MLEEKLKKKYCSGIPETVFGKYIGRCCRQHDNNCGERGSKDFLSHMKTFYKCLQTKGLNKFISSVITLGGTLGCGLKWYFLLKRKDIYKSQHK